jgi:AcrR family transcriptional regulator
VITEATKRRALTQRAAPTRERILDAAIELFGRQGYSGTTVGEIEAAAGLVPRSGALYKHFASKRELLEEAMRQRTRAVADLEQAVDASMLGDARREVRLLGRMALHEIGEDQSILRIVMREGDNFPELRDEFKQRIVDRGHAKLVDWLRLAARRAGASEPDVDAIATVILGPPINYRVLETLFGGGYGDVDEERFLDVWTDSTIKLLEAHGLVADDPKEAPR